ncbi:MAG: glycosyl hydrolase family 28 protein [Bacteroidota bacterium]
MRELRLIWSIYLICGLGMSWAQTKLPVYNVLDYGAQTDTQTLSTRGIQQAIDAAHSAGGGTVYLPPGNYLSGSLQLKSYVSLHLEAGATLFASRRSQDFGLEGSRLKQPVLIYASKAEHIAIRGKGRIHGQGRRSYEDLKKVDNFIKDITRNAEEFGVEMKMYYRVAPWVSTIFMHLCKDVTIEDISVIDAGFWLMDLKQCQRVFIRGAYLESDLDQGVNADGIDIDGCQDVTISDCIVYTGDDAIVLKANQNPEGKYDCENVTVSNCVVSSTSTGLKLGTESYGNIRHIVFNNCVVRNSNRGLSIVVRDGATVENVIFSNITIETNRKHFNWWGDGDPIWVVLKKRRASSKLGTIKNVLFENIIAHGQGTSRIEGYTPDTLHPEGGYLHNIQLRNVQLTMYPEAYADKRATHGFEAHHVDGLVLEDVKIEWDEDAPEPRWQSGISISEVKNLRMDEIETRQGLSASNHPAVSLHNIEEALLSDLHALPGTGTMLQISGSNTNKIFFRGLDVFGRSRTKLQKTSSLKAEAVTKVD